MAESRAPIGNAWCNEHQRMPCYELHGQAASVAEEPEQLDLDAVRNRRRADSWRDIPALTDAIEQLTLERDELLAELDGRTEEAAERWIAKQMDETAIRSMDFRNGAHMDLQLARDLLGTFVAAARTMLGDATNYTETRVSLHAKVAESPELYTLVVQRHGPGVLTPHEARLRAEAERDEARAELERLRTGETCQVGQPYACGDFHTAGQCVRGGRR